MPTVVTRQEKGFLAKWKYKYEVERDVYVCPQGEEIRYDTTDRDGYCHYKSDPQQCEIYPLLTQRTQNQNHQKTITRHVWEEDKEQVRMNRLSNEGKWIYRMRKEKVKEQALMTAACQNMKKIAYHLARVSCMEESLLAIS
ncbi:hypothetical protein BN982_00258 [Halobacillus karajensis]|uniref:Transposase DDE domain-containing protein n=1 Tax=Halobacillus karajensis TaxID=195088 RepID=A0A024P7N1_9BACI|nr:hypothetical protein BN982_00258 [Halobacillus karajensis]CDQ24362.1 hypothetical protein BN983_02641 [Halobacillus karajensis]CDQ29389.1 hypothetical protein BN981_03765 [Halobacillus karajensis]